MKEKILEVNFEIKTNVVYQDVDFDGVVSGTCEVVEYMYGSDRDGNRGELRQEVCITEIHEIAIELDEEEIKFIQPVDCDNWDEIKKQIYESSLSELS